MIARSLAALLGGLLLLVSPVISVVQAQQWAQEVQVITTVGYGEPLHAFVDSLNSVLTRNPDVQVRRTPEDETTMPFSDLQDLLFREGIDLNSASHAFIRYRFDMEGGSRIVETIEEMYFIYRGREDRSDLPILHVDTRTPEVNDLITHSGIPSPVNLMAIRTYRDMLAFPYLNSQQETLMVEIAGRAVRQEDSQQQHILTEFLTDQMTLGGGSYVLGMPEVTVTRVATAPATDEIK